MHQVKLVWLSVQDPVERVNFINKVYNHYTYYIYCLASLVQQLEWNIFNEQQYFSQTKPDSFSHIIDSNLMNVKSGWFISISKTYLVPYIYFHLLWIIKFGLIKLNSTKPVYKHIFRISSNVDLSTYLLNYTYGWTFRVWPEWQRGLE